MRINTEDSIRQAKAARDRYGSWAEAKEAGRREAAERGEGARSDGASESGRHSKR